jgi:uncharacterized protein (TIGR00251 family)
VIGLQQHPLGVILPVRAQAAARQNEIRGEQNGMIKVSVTQAPEKGKANRAIINVLADRLSLRRSQIELVSGETSHQKQFLVRDISLKALSDRIAAIIE